MQLTRRDSSYYLNMRKLNFLELCKDRPIKHRAKKKDTHFHRLNLRIKRNNGYGYIDLDKICRQLNDIPKSNSNWSKAEIKVTFSYGSNHPFSNWFTLVPEFWKTTSIVFLFLSLMSLYLFISHKKSLCNSLGMLYLPNTEHTYSLLKLQLRRSLHLSLSFIAI